MIDVFAVLSLASAAAKSENPVQLFSDAELLYAAYAKLKAKTESVDQIAASGQLKPLVQAAARVTAVANTVVDDPAQMKNLASLLSSI